jgi:hypothetical protein
MNSMLERVCNVCNTVRDQVSEPTTFKKLIIKTRKTLKIHNFFIDLKTKKDKTLTEDQWYVLAYYDPINDQQSETSIEIIVYHNLNGDEQFKSPQVTELLTEIYNALAHELKHQQQSIKRDFREWVVHPSTDDYKKYLANQDELDAYALSIAIELLRNMDLYRAKFNLSRITVMSKMRKGSTYVSPTLRAYIQHFGLNRLVKCLAKKIYKHLETIDRRYIFM